MKYRCLGYERENDSNGNRNRNDVRTTHKMQRKSGNAEWSDDGGKQVERGVPKTARNGGGGTGPRHFGTVAKL